jgi:hypothetical protein
MWMEMTSACGAAAFAEQHGSWPLWKAECHRDSLPRTSVERTPVSRLQRSRVGPQVLMMLRRGRSGGTALPGPSGSAWSGRTGHFPGRERVPAKQGLDGQRGGAESDGVRAEVAKPDRGPGEQMPE